MSKVEIINCLEIIKKSGGTFFSVLFVKKDGSLREMVARLGVTKGVKGVGRSYNEIKKFNLLTVWDVQKKAFRRIQLGTIKELKVRGVEIKTGR